MRFVCALAQPPDSQAVFEVATVKHGLPGDYGARGSVGSRHARPNALLGGKLPYVQLAGDRLWK